MAIRSDITKAYDWFYGEAKVLVITVLDTAGQPVNLGASTLEWKVTKQQGSSQVYLTKGTGGNGITVGGAGNNVVTITISASTDYDTLTAGIHYHELWDVGNNLLLSYGDAHVRKTVGHSLP